MTCLLDIYSEPPGAEVYISDEYRGTTPTSDIYLMEGSYKIEIRKEGYVTVGYLGYQIKSTDLIKNINVTLKPVGVDFGELVVKSDPTGAKVYIEDDYVGRTTYRNETMAPGTYDIYLKLEGWGDIHRRIEIKEGETTTIEANFEKEAEEIGEGEAIIDTNPTGAQFYINNVLKGKTPYHTGPFSSRFSRAFALAFTCAFTCG